MSLRARYRSFDLQRKSTPASAVDEPAYELVGRYLGFIQPVSGSEAAQFNALNESRSHRLYTDVATPVQFGDRIVQDGINYNAVFVTQVTGISSVGHHKEVDLQSV